MLVTAADANHRRRAGAATWPSLSAAAQAVTFTGEGVRLVEAGTAPEDLFRGFLRELRFAFNALSDTDARRSVFEMRRVFRRHCGELVAVAVTAVRV